VDKLPGFEQRLVDFLAVSCRGDPPLPPNSGHWTSCDAAWGTPSACAGGATSRQEGSEELGGQHLRDRHREPVLQREDPRLQEQQQQQQSALAPAPHL
jgi:hypothetical protein